MPFCCCVFCGTLNSRIIVDFGSRGVTGNDRLNPLSTVTVSILPSDRVYADPDSFTKQQRPIEVLIGSDQYYQAVKGLKHISQSFVLLDTIFGDIPAGSIELPVPSRIATSLNSVTKLVRKETLTSSGLAGGDIDQFWNLETLGISKRECDTTSDRVIANFHQTTKRVKGCYEVKLPWKVDWKVLHTHLRMYEKRLQSLLKTCPPELLTACNAIIEE